MRIVLLFVTAVTLAVAVVTSSHAARLVIDDRAAARGESVAATCAPDPVTVKVMREGYNPPPPVIPVS